MPRSAPWTAACAAYAALAAAAAAPPPCSGDQAGAWTDLAARLAAEESPTPAAAVQAQSMVRAAVAEALDRGAALERRGGAGQAAAVAAHDVLWRLYPRRRELLDASLRDCAPAAASPAGQAGARAAARVLRVQWPGALGPERSMPRALPAVARPPAPGPARSSPKALERGPASTQPWWREHQPVSL